MGEAGQQGASHSARQGATASCPPFPQPPPGSSPPLQPPRPLHQLHPGDPTLWPWANLKGFHRALPLPPSALPFPRNSRTPPTANLGSRCFSSSFEAWLAASRPVSSFRLPLLFLTLARPPPSPIGETPAWGRGARGGSALGWRWDAREALWD